MSDVKTKPRVLHVEDDLSFIATLRPLLEVFCEVDVANTCDEAIDKLLESDASGDRYQLIILDMWVPLRPGEPPERYSAIHHLRIESRIGLVETPTPIFVFTGHPDYDQCAECIRQGAADYLPKAQDGDFPAYMSDNPGGEIATNVGEAIRRIKKLLGVPLEQLGKEPHSPSLDRWMTRNNEQILDKFTGKYLGLVTRFDGAFSSKDLGSIDPPAELIDGRVVISRDTEEEVRHSFLKSKELRWDDINLAYIPDERMENDE
jgi:CheY-like chemotaxis protein